jgi:hypothetical protein
MTNQIISIVLESLLGAGCGILAAYLLRKFN